MLAQIQVDKGLAALPIAEVRSIDRQLVDGWGVEFTADDLTDLLARIPDQKAAERYVLAHNSAYTKLRRTASSMKAEEELFAAMAHPQLLGLVTSARRAAIVDAVAVTVALVRYLRLEGAVLDIGCHAGITTSLIASILKRPVIGIDPCGEAIMEGLRHPSRDKRVELCHARIPWETGRRFDIALSLDAMPQVPASAGPYLRNVSQLLNPGGIAVIASSYWQSADVNLTRRQLHAAGMGYGYSDVLGGLGGHPPKFKATAFLVLVKGTGSIIPRDYLARATDHWSDFARYANDHDVLPREKTQAFHRAKPV